MTSDHTGANLTEGANATESRGSGALPVLGDFELAEEAMHAAEESAAQKSKDIEDPAERVRLAQEAAPGTAAR